MQPDWPDIEIAFLSFSQTFGNTYNHVNELLIRLMKTATGVEKISFLCLYILGSAFVHISKSVF